MIDILFLYKKKHFKLWIKNGTSADQGRTREDIVEDILKYEEFKTQIQNSNSTKKIQNPNTTKNILR